MGKFIPAPVTEWQAGTQNLWNNPFKNSIMNFYVKILCIYLIKLMKTGWLDWVFIK